MTSYRYRQHISKARAAASVHGPDILAALVTAEYAEGDSCITDLEDALQDAEQLVADIKNAVAKEKAAIEQKKRQVPTAARAPRTPEEALPHLMDFVMFGTPIFRGERK